MPGILRELAFAADADIGAPVCNDRGRRTHAADGKLRPVGQLPCTICTFLHPHAVKIAALGVKIERLCRGIVADRAADISCEAVHRIQKRAALRIQQQEVGRRARVAALAVICSDQNVVAAHISACPVEAALLHIAPRFSFCFQLAGRDFIGQGQTDEACVLDLAVPEARVGVAVRDRNRAVRLTAERIGVKPERFQRICVECLNASVGKTDQNHALGIGRVVDGKAGRTRHRAFLQNLSGVLVNLHDFCSGVGNQIPADQNRVADGSFIVSLADLACPIECAVFCRKRNFRIRHAVIRVGRAGHITVCIICRAAEVRPFGGDFRVDGGIGLRCGQLERNGGIPNGIRRFRHECFRAVRLLHPAKLQGHFAAAARCQLDCAALPGVTVFCQAVAIGKARREAVFSGFIRPDTDAAERLINVKRRVRGCKGKFGRRACRLLNSKHIAARGGASVAVGQRNRNRFRSAVAAECDLNRFVRLLLRVIHQQHIAAVRFSVARAVSHAKRQLQSRCHTRNGDLIRPLQGLEAGQAVLIMQYRRNTTAGSCQAAQRKLALDRYNVVRRIGHALRAAGRNSFGDGKRQRVAGYVSKQDRVGKLRSLRAGSRDILHDLLRTV